MVRRRAECRGVERIRVNNDNKLRLAEAAFRGALIIVVEFFLERGIIRLLAIDEFPREPREKRHAANSDEPTKNGDEDNHGAILNPNHSRAAHESLLRSRAA